MSESVVKGPYSRSDWKTMLGLRRSIKALEQEKANAARKFTIRNDRRSLKEFLQREAA